MVDEVKVLYWKNYCDPTGVLDTNPQAQELIDNLMMGLYKESDLELLKGHKVYSARLNDTDRLLLSTKEENGEEVLVILEVVYNHDYKKSKFLGKSSVLKYFMEKHATAFNRPIEASDFIKGASLPENLKKSKLRKKGIPFHFEPASLYKNKFIEFNDGQNCAQRITLPGEIDGPGGSGKTIVGLAIAQQAIADSEAFDDPVLIVAKSPKLIKSIREQVEPLAEGNANCFIESLTYAQVIAKFDERVADILPDTEEELFDVLESGKKIERVADADFFETWLQAYIKDYCKKSRGVLSETVKKVLANSFLIYPEFYILSGYEGDVEEENAYFKLGSKSCHFVDLEQKEWLLAAYKDYLLTLKASNTIDFSFHSLNGVDPQYQLIAVEEGQDLTHRQLLELYRLAKDARILFLVDTHQMVGHHYRKSVRPQLDHLCKGKLSRAQLLHSERCGNNVIKLINEFIQLKMRFTGGLSDRDEIAEIPLRPGAPNGKVGLLTDKNPEILKRFIAKHSNSTQFVILARPEHLELARARFPSVSIIYTPEQFKGLELRDILVFEPFSHKTFATVNRVLAADKNGAGNEKHYHHRAKNKEGHDETMGVFFNEVITALGRTTGSVTIYQSNTNKFSLSHLIDRVGKVIDDLETNEPPEINTPAVTTDADWWEEYDTQLKSGNKDNANHILRTHLKGAVREKSQITITEIPSNALHQNSAEKKIEMPDEEQIKEPIVIINEKQIQPDSSSEPPKVPFKVQKPKASTKTVSKVIPLTANETALKNIFNNKGDILRQPMEALLTKAKNSLALLFETNVLVSNSSSTLFCEITCNPSQIKWLSKDPLKSILKKAPARVFFTPSNSTDFPPIWLYIAANFYKDKKILWDSFLKDVINKSSFTQTITGRELCLPCSLNLTTLFKLSDHMNDPTFDSLKKMWSKNKNLVKGITASVLYGRATAPDRRNNGVFHIKEPLIRELKNNFDYSKYNNLFAGEKSPFELLSYTKDTIPFLLAIYEENPLLIADLPIDMLVGSNNSILVSPLAHLLIDDNGRKLVKLFCTHNPLLQKAIFSWPKKNLLFDLENYYKSFEASNISTNECNNMREILIDKYDVVGQHFIDILYCPQLNFIHLLIFYDTDCDLLNFLMDNDDWFALKLTFTDLWVNFETNPDGDDPVWGTGIYQLVTQPNGITALKKLLIKNRSLLQGNISREILEDLIAVKIVDGQHDDGSYYSEFIPSSDLAQALEKDSELLALFCKNKTIYSYLEEWGFAVPPKPIHPSPFTLYGNSSKPTDSEPVTILEDGVNMSSVNNNF